MAVMPICIECDWHEPREHVESDLGVKTTVKEHYCKHPVARHIVHGQARECRDVRAASELCGVHGLWFTKR